MKKLAVALFLPAVAIFGAAFAQHLLTLLWPQIQQIPSAKVSFDSYLETLMTAALCFFCGLWIRGNVGLRAGAALMTVAPLVFLTLIIISITMDRGSIAWLRPINMFLLFTAVAPIMSVSFGWWRGHRKSSQKTAALPASARV